METFTDQAWTDALSTLKEVIGTEADRYSDDPEARLIAAIPFLSGSEDPDRFALSNLLTLHGIRKARTLFAYRPSDQDIFRRWATYHVGNHSEPRVVDFGLTLLALGHLNQAAARATEDQKRAVPNPVNSGDWGPGLRTELESEIARNPWLLEQFQRSVPHLGI